MCDTWYTCISTRTYVHVYILTLYIVVHSIRETQIVCILTTGTVEYVVASRTGKQVWFYLTVILYSVHCTRALYVPVPLQCT